MCDSKKEALDSFAETKDFHIERLNYIYEQLKGHNEGVYKDFSLFVKIITAIYGAGLGLFAAGTTFPHDTILTLLRGLVLLSVGVTIFTLFSVLCHILAWLDYRREETALLNQHPICANRKHPSFSNAWRWRETYVLLVVAVFLLLCVYCLSSSKVEARVRTLVTEVSQDKR